MNFNISLINYESLKLTVQNPESINIQILAFILLVCVASLKKNGDQQILGKDQSNQIKGLAIVLVILGHLWVHVVGVLPRLLFGGEAVAMFLLLSGYGLAVSYKRREIKFKDYVTARLKRVMVLYWIVTGFFIALDYTLLSRTYSTQDIVMTLLGININITTRYIDYVRWFVTFILIWYVTFYYATIYFSQKVKIVFLIVFAAVFFISDYYVMHFGFYQFSAFPVGCAIGVYISQITGAIQKIPLRILAVAAATIAVLVLYKFTYSEKLCAYVPTIVCKAHDEIVSVTLCLAVLALMGTAGMLGYKSVLLCIWGKISYEMFLLHGAFLVKYNPIIDRSEATLHYTFSIFIIFVTLIALIAHRSIVAAYASRKL